MRLVYVFMVLIMVNGVGAVSFNCSTNNLSQSFDFNISSYYDNDTALFVSNSSMLFFNETLVFNNSTNEIFYVDFVLNESFCLLNDSSFFNESIDYSFNKSGNFSRILFVTSVFVNETIEVNETINESNETVVLPQFEIDKNNFYLPLNSSDLPINISTIVRINSPLHSTVRIVCDGYLHCPDEIIIDHEGGEPVNITARLPENLSGTYNMYAIFIRDNRSNFFEFTIDVYDDIGVTPEIDRSLFEIERCVREQNKSIMDCLIHLANQTTIINHTVYEEVEVPVEAIRFSDSFAEKLYGLDDERQLMKNITEITAEKVGNNTEALTNTMSAVNFLIEEIKSMKENSLKEKNDAVEEAESKASRKFWWLLFVVVLSSFIYLYFTQRVDGTVPL